MIIYKKTRCFLYISFGSLNKVEYLYSKQINKSMILEGLVVQSFIGEIDCGHFNSDSNTKEYWLTGYCVIYTNGYKTISGGGSASSRDVSWFYILDENNKCIEEY